jgi:hypothetical protein
LSRQISQREWKAQTDALDARQGNDMVSQQRVFRLFQALAHDDMELADALIESGVALDQLLWREPLPESVPGADQFFELFPHSVSCITLLAYAAVSDRADLIAWLLAQGASVSMVYQGGRDAAWAATEAGHGDSYSLLMDEGASINLRLDEEPRMTRLMGAVVARREDIVADLLRRRARVDDYDNEGRTALNHNLRQIPYAQEDLNIGRLLLAAQADVLVTDNDGVKPVDMMLSDEQLALMAEFNIQKPAQRPRYQRPEPDAPEPVAPTPPAPRPQPQPGAAPRGPRPGGPK